eukprot:GFUD01012679.1.p1 GENE.GFUD01012679.1~~GFUD01012679.1.p1  ORF type:complete len:104 (-),score=12.21 GFUD01012679.1:69-353(-)
MRCLFIFSLLLITAQSVPVRKSLQCSPDICLNGTVTSTTVPPTTVPSTTVPSTTVPSTTVPSTITGEWCPVKFQKLTCVISSSIETCTGCCCIP